MNRFPDLDKSKGRVQILEGDLYYSPNCDRDVQLPAPHKWGANPFSPPNLQNQKQNLWQLDTSNYEHPPWWSDFYGWIAFYNKDILDVSCSLLRTLKHSTAQYTFEDDIGYTLPQWQAKEWLHLDTQLASACAELMGHYRPTYALPPIRPWAFGYLRPHWKRGILSLCLEKSKKWFGVWFALLSFLIAVSETREFEEIKDRVLARQNWKNVLVAKCAAVQIDAAWIDLLLDSTVASFSPFVRRTGTFVYITPGDPVQNENRFQPSVSWFVEHGVPVWYRWDTDAASFPRNQYLAPLEFQLQQVGSFMHQSPSLPVLPVVASADNDRLHSYQIEKLRSTVQMDAFFKLREERTARLIQNETSEQRALRLSRQKQHPTVNSRVFEWTPNAAGEFVSEEILTKPRRKEVLNDYRGQQRRYNAVLNEWHVCVLWDHFDDSDDDDYFPPIFEGDDVPPDSSTIMQTYGHDTYSDDVWIPNQGELENRQALQLQTEILEVATLYFGYTARVPLPQVASQTEQEQKKFCRDFGLIWDQVVPLKEALDYPAIAAVMDFFKRLAGKGALSPEEWDLSDDNQQPVHRLPRFRLFRPVFPEQTEKTKGSVQTLYMLDLGSKATAPWRLAVKSASDALMICRLDPKFTEYEIVDHLLTNGIAFHTLQPSRALTRTPDGRPSLVPLMRGEGYTFGRRDYLAYRDHCQAILNHPRGRAALMHGHFMWRIAFRSVMWEDVYSGPSGWSTDSDEMIVVKDHTTNTEFVDDKLSTAEQEALCGTYHCLTGELRQSCTKPLN
jgi:hypothetical protein